MGTGYCYGCMEHIVTYPCPKCGYTPAHSLTPYALQPGTILNGKYLVGKVLGQGGFGITYIGFDLQLQRKVAIKEYYPAGLLNRKAESSEVIWYASEVSQEARRSGQDMVIQVVIQDTVILQSGRIVPGNQVTELSLAAGMVGKLLPGGYDGKFVIHYYDPETGEKAIVNAEIPIKITVKE